MDWSCIHSSVLGDVVSLLRDGRASDALVYLALLSHRNAETGLACVGVDIVMDITGLSRRGVRVARARLIVSGHLERAGVSDARMTIFNFPKHNALVNGECTPVHTIVHAGAHITPHVCTPVPPPHTPPVESLLSELSPPHIVPPPRVDTPPSLRFSELSDAWNAMATPSGLPRCHGASSKRLAAWRVRLSDPGWASSWREALGRVPACPFLRGENDRGWRANIDWFLKPDSVTRILEGAYSGTPRPSGPGAPAKPAAPAVHYSTLDEALKRRRERLERGRING